MYIKIYCRHHRSIFEELAAVPLPECPVSLDITGSRAKIVSAIEESRGIGLHKPERIVKGRDGPPSWSNRYYTQVTNTLPKAVLQTSGIYTYQTLCKSVFPLQRKYRKFPLFPIISYFLYFLCTRKGSRKYFPGNFLGND